MIKPLHSFLMVITICLLLFSSSICTAAKILVIPKNIKSAYWSVVEKGAQQAGDDLGINVTWRGPSREDQRDTQIKIIEYGIREQYDAIAFAPSHTDAAADVLKIAAEKGIKIVIIDSKMTSDHHRCLVESNNYKAGQTAAVHLAQLLGGKGRVILVRHIENNASTNDREQGFLDTIKSNYPRLQIVADPYTGPTIGTAYRTMSTLFEKERDFDGIFSVNGIITQGTLQALQQKGLQKEIKFIGFDLNSVIIDAITNHQLDATIVQDPYKIGYTGVEVAHQLILNKAVSKKILTDTVLLTTDNYHTDKIQEFITPHLP